MVTAIFTGNKSTSARDVWQYDYGQMLRIQGLKLPNTVEIHFSLQETGGTAAMRVGVTKDGVTDVLIPDSMLENGDTTMDYPIFAFIYLTDAVSGQTEYKIKIYVKSRPKPEAPGITPEPEPFHAAVQAVNDAANRAAESERQAEGYTHGRTDLPERAMDNAKYYKDEAGKSAAEADRLAKSIAGVDLEVKKDLEQVQELTKQAQTSATNAGLSEQAAQQSETAAGVHRAAAETAENNAEFAEQEAKKAEQATLAAKQLVMQMGQQVLDNKNHVDQVVQGFELTAQQNLADVNNAGQTQTKRVTDAGTNAVDDINTAKTAAVQEVTNEGTKQVNLVGAEGKKQLDAVNLAVQGIEADRQQIEQNTMDITTVKNDLNALESYVATSVLPTTWKEIQNAIKSGFHKKIYKVGDKITDVWKDPNDNMKAYDNPWRINHFEDGLPLENGTLVNGMWLQTQYAQLKGVQFSHSRAFLRCPTGLKAGTYYFTIESKWGSNVAANDVVCFTLTKDVPAGGRIAGCYFASETPKSNWRIYAYSADGKTILETATPTFTVPAAGTNLGIQKFNTRTGDLNSTQEMAHGCNRWKTSAMRQYLNSDKPKGEWWVAQDEWDIAPNQLSQIDGYLKGFSPEILAAIQPVKCVTYGNDTTEAGVEDVTYDKVILPSNDQMYIKNQGNAEGTQHQYYKELSGRATPYEWYQTYPELITYAIEDPSSAQHVRFRSADRINSYRTWYVTPSSSIHSGYAPNTFRPAPLVFIGTTPAIPVPTDTGLAGV